MSFQEKRSVVSLISNILIFVLYYLQTFHYYQQGNLTPADEFSFWGAAILLFIPISIVIKIVIHILFSIINTIATKEKEPSFSDELDKLIDLKATRNLCYAFLTGFFLAMGSLVLKMPSIIMFNLLLFSIILAGITLDISKLYYHRKGISNE